MKISYWTILDVIVTVSCVVLGFELVFVCMCVCACVCLCVLFVQGVSFDMSCGQFHGTWEYIHNDQVILRVYKCTGVSTDVKQIILEGSLKIVVVESCMYYEINAVIVKYKSRGNAAGKAYSMAFIL